MGGPTKPSPVLTMGFRPSRITPKPMGLTTGKKPVPESFSETYDHVRDKLDMGQKLPSMPRSKPPSGGGNVKAPASPLEQFLGATVGRIRVIQDEAIRKAREEASNKAEARAKAKMCDGPYCSSKYMDQEDADIDYWKHIFALESMTHWFCSYDCEEWADLLKVKP